MNTTTTIGLTLLLTSGAAMGGPVYDLQPGEFYDQLSGITSAQFNELRGATEFDQHQSLEVYSDEGVGSSLLYEAMFLTRLVRSYDTGNLTFNFQIYDANPALMGQVKHIEITGFSGLETRVEYRNEAGYADQGPDSASRSDDGGTLSFNFGEDFETGETSMFFFAMTDAAEYDFDAINPQATVYLYSGDSITLDIDNPIPTPGSLALLGTAGLCLSRRRR